MTTATYFATCAKGLEPLLFDELQQLNLPGVKQTQAGCYFEGEIADAYRACLWSRIASRILLKLGQAPAQQAQDIPAAVAQTEWEQHFTPGHTFSVDFNGSHEEIRHTQFGAQLVKDGIVDRFRAIGAERPSVDRQQPQLRIAAHLHKHQLSWYIDLSGESLHRRGYRQAQGSAPLRENLAAAVAIRAGVTKSDVSTNPGVVVDPFCGSGTLLIEAAMIMLDRAPGLYRSHWGFSDWLQHQEAQWQTLITEAEQRFAAAAQQSIQLFGYDTDTKLVSIAQANVERAKLEDFIAISVGDATNISAPAPAGLLLANPPYGERLGEELETLLLYRRLGQNLRQQFSHYQVALLAGDETLLKRLKLRSHRRYKLYNGQLDVILALYDMTKEQTEFTESKSDDIANRLKKNYKKLEKWAAQEGLTAWRLYDADLPEYNAAVDVYGDFLMIQEYAAPKQIPEDVARDRLWHLLDTAHQVLPFSAQNMTLKVRQRQTGKQQYQKQKPLGWTTQVHEYGALFEVNLTDYLDAGLFLDHRLVRREIGALSQAKHVLNLFAYTCTASVHAALGGAASVTSVDMSRTYLDWGIRNFELNGLRQRQYQFVQADCLQWLRQQPPQQRFDLIFIDPPTFSNSKRMEDSFDVQRDHVNLLKLACRLLKDDGVIIFSNNKRKFKLDDAGIAEFGMQAEDITQRTLPVDFGRNARIHQVYKLRFSDAV